VRDTIDDLVAEDDCQDTNIQLEPYIKVGSPTVNHTDKMVLSVSSKSWVIDDTSSVHNIFEDLSHPHMSTLSNNNTSRNTTRSVTVRQELKSAEIGDLSEMGCRSASPVVNINIAELQGRVDELMAKLK